ncbi:MAG: flagellar basal body rod protein FlgC, partial [Bdellovibrionales bacterium]|nr:flagellar basal body rod protein FlgC [Bdellovibrionales bacterium]
MSMFKATDVIAHGLSAARKRMEVYASNVANAETTRTPEGGPYKRRDILQIAQSVKSNFSNTLDQASLFKPRVAAVVADSKPPKMEFNPSHPDANEEGFVAKPNINVVSEMVNMTTAARLYQANVKALQIARKMERDAAQI